MDSTWREEQLKRTHVASPKCTCEHCFVCQRVRQGVFFEKKKKKTHPILQLLFLSQTGGGVGDVGWAGEGG